MVATRGLKVRKFEDTDLTPHLSVREETEDSRDTKILSVRAKS